MAKLHQIATLAHIIDKENDRLNKDIPAGMPPELAYTHESLIRTTEAVTQFKAARKDLTDRQVDKVLRNALSEGFIEEIVFKLHPNTLGVELRNCLKVSDGKGLNLIQKRWGIPTGLIREVLNDNKEFTKLITVAGGVVIAICTVIGVYLTTHPPH